MTELVERRQVAKNPIPDITERDRNRFWSKVAVREPDDCWEWQSYTTYQGYGQFYLAGRQYRASRVSYVLAGNDLGLDQVVCHRCDNPPCVNPNHLFAGSVQDNIIDAATKGRKSGPNVGRGKTNRAKTHCPRGHPYSGDNLYLSPKGARFCRECRRQRHRQYDNARSERDQLTDRIAELEGALEEAAQTFRRYEQNHLDKAHPWQHQLTHFPEDASDDLEQRIAETQEKARANAEKAERYEALLARSLAGKG